MIHIDIPFDPYEGLSPSVKVLADRYLFDCSEDEADSRGESLFVAAASALETLVDESGETDASYRRAAATEGKRILTSSFDELPTELATAVIDQFTSSSLEDRLVLLHCLRRLGRESWDMALDEEKLLGHLILSHGHTVSPESIEPSSRWFAIHSSAHLQ